MSINIAVFAVVGAAIVALVFGARFVRKVANEVCWNSLDLSAPQRLPGAMRDTRDNHR